MARTETEVVVRSAGRRRFSLFSLLPTRHCAKPKRASISIVATDREMEVLPVAKPTNAGRMKKSFATRLATVFLARRDRERDRDAERRQTSPTKPRRPSNTSTVSSESTESTASDGANGVHLAPNSNVPTVEAITITTESKPSKPTKHVRWQQADVLQFRVGFNACAVPNSGGPPIGLTGTPIATETVPLHDDDPAILDEEDARPHSSANDCWLDPIERMEILQQESHLKVEDIAVMCDLTRAIQDSRRLSCLDFDMQTALNDGDAACLRSFAQLRACIESRHPARAREGIVLFQEAP